MEKEVARVVHKRCPTGITGFDNLCQGGFYRNSINTVLGGPGSGKTTFLLQFLWNGIKMYDEKGLYISFEAHDEDVFQDAKSYGWDFLKLSSEGKFKFLRIFPKTTIEDLRHQVEKLVLSNNLSRVCIDPIGILSMRLKDEAIIREAIYDLTTMLKRLDITTVVADETVEGTIDNYSLGNDETRTQSIKFLCDGLINLYSSGLGGESDRAVRITKMRRTDHVRGPVPFKITDKGIVVYYKKK